jgi:hypothetical protein
MNTYRNDLLRVATRRLDREAAAERGLRIALVVFIFAVFVMAQATA